MEKLSEGLYVHKYNHQTNASVAISFGKEGDKVADMADATDSGSRKVGKYYVPRGDKDNKLLLIHKLLDESPNKWQFLETKANFTFGKGPALFEEHEDVLSLQKPIKSKDFSDWVKRLRIKNLTLKTANQVVYSYELNWLVSLDAKTKKVASVKVLDNNDVRVAKLSEKDTEIKGFYVHSGFGYKTPAEKDAVFYPAFDPDEPTKYGDFIIHEIITLPGQKFYGLASWWGTSRWAEVANKVPSFYEAAFKNGYFITHQVSIPTDYWDKDGWDEVKKAEEKKKTLDSIADTLSGVEESNKILFTFSKYNSDMRSTSGIEIKPVEFNIKDDAFIKMFDKANDVQIGGHGLVGKLAGVDSGSKMGTSGMEINSLANYVQNFLVVQQRELILTALDYLKEIDDIEPDYVIGFKNIMGYVPDSTAKNDPAHPNNQVNDNAN
ncbi:MAG TPA: hypothetical protein VK175_06345 [Leadbetterella sp.]|nr:hypothetical protein [Leadbetterella sp.]